MFSLQDVKQKVVVSEKRLANIYILHVIRRVEIPKGANILPVFIDCMCQCLHGRVSAPKKVMCKSEKVKSGTFESRNYILRNI